MNSPSILFTAFNNVYFFIDMYKLFILRLKLYLLQTHLHRISMHYFEFGYIRISPDSPNQTLGASLFSLYFFCNKFPPNKVNLVKGSSSSAHPHTRSGLLRERHSSPPRHQGW